MPKACNLSAISPTCVKDVLRLTTKSISDVVLEIACGLHNLCVRCRPPLLTFDLLAWLGFKPIMSIVWLAICY